jgi:uncharacterized membrane protein (DUF485 family)
MKQNKKIIFLILLGFLMLPLLASAQVTIQSMVDAAVQTTLYIASGIVVILWVVTGILFLTAQGAPEKLSTAKKALFAAVVGTVLVLVAQGAFSIVGGALNI